ncbi:hypothetical protein B0I35DRAFT_113637 [Stachybotrys elegans]|uniref:Uncharacterized protein n=1 Tax=Stachybotrys elegans TaxID=80388 RepID=A0A8K0WM65_9HYPO|nr:hypothetical protein B0I35DRAFT_113637 [Stachybotrys elegans]
MYVRHYEADGERLYISACTRCVSLLHLFYPTASQDLSPLGSVQFITKPLNPIMAPVAQYIEAFLSRRQQDNSPPEDTSDQSASSSNLSGGAIAGIVIGSIFGVLLLWWIFRSCGSGFGFGARTTPAPPPAGYYHHEKHHGRGRSRSSHRRHHHHHSPRRSGSLRPVVIETHSAVPRAPAPVHGYQTHPVRGYDNGYAYEPRSHSRRRSSHYYE